MPTTYSSGYHSLATLLFGLFGIMHFSVTICHGMYNTGAKLVLWTGIIGFMGMIVYFPLYNIVVKWFSLWAVELVGFFALIWYTPAIVLLWSKEEKEF